MLALLLRTLLAAQEPLPPEETVARFQRPEGFSAVLFAGEPELRQPISFCIDDRGRPGWIAWLPLPVLGAVDPLPRNPPARALRTSGTLLSRPALPLHRQIRLMRPGKEGGGSEESVSDRRAG